MAKRKETSTELQLLKTASVQPPSAPEIEMAVLGAMLLDSAAVPRAIELLQADSFTLAAHKNIFEAIVLLFEANEAVDTVTVYEELKKQDKIEEVGGAAYLSKLTQEISSASNLQYHAKIILEKAIMRRLVTSAHEIAAKAYEAKDDAFDMLDFAERKIFEITERYLHRSYQNMEYALREAMEYIEAIHSQQIKKNVVPTGFIDLDDKLGGGFQKSDLIIIAARPSMGKTALALSMARNAAVAYEKGIAIFSLEMSTIQLILRLISAEGSLDAHKLRTGKLPASEGPRLAKTYRKLFKAPIYIDDTPAQTILEVRAKARRLKHEKQIDLIVIDYLQLMQGPEHMSRDSREREISHISRSLKALAKELDIPVVALAQLNRMVESRTDKRPQLSDLRESGSIEQDADVVLFIYRAEKYKHEEENEESIKGVAEIIIAKQRNGPTGEVKLKFTDTYARFDNLDQFRSQLTDGTPIQLDNEIEESII